jgi:hypothetical protein
MRSAGPLKCKSVQSHPAAPVDIGWLALSSLTTGTALFADGGVSVNGHDLFGGAGAMSARQKVAKPTLLFCAI